MEAVEQLAAFRGGACSDRCGSGPGRCRRGPRPPVRGNPENMVPLRRGGTCVRGRRPGMSTAPTMLSQVASAHLRRPCWPALPPEYPTARWEPSATAEVLGVERRPAGRRARGIRVRGAPHVPLTPSYQHRHRPASLATAETNSSSNWARSLWPWHEAAARRTEAS